MAALDGMTESPQLAALIKGRLREGEEEIFWFIVARLNSDEGSVKVAASLQLDPENGWARLGRDVEALRAVLMLTVSADDIHYERQDEVGADLPDMLIGERMRRQMASAWEDHPYYKPEWALSCLEAIAESGPLDD